MKITSIEIIQQIEGSKLPRDYAWLLIHTDEGLVGLGELNRRPNEIIAILRDWAPHLLIGQDARHIERNIVSIVNPDLAWVGGITEIKRIGIIAKTHGVAVAPHDSGPVTTYARCHVMANMSNAFFMELSSATSGMWDCVTEKLEMEDSSLPLPMKPGLGVELNPEIIEASRWREKKDEA